MPTASTNAYRHAAEIGGHEGGDMPWSTNAYRHTG